MRRELERLKRLLSPSGASSAGGWLFADDVSSAVSFRECERLVELARGASVLEVGSYYGRSTIALASAAEVVHSIDPHMGGPDDSRSTIETFLGNLERYGVRDKVVIHMGLSTQILPLLHAEVFDFVFIDAMHQRPDVDVDFALAAPALRAAGSIAFHDYGVDGVQVGEIWHSFGVTEAVDELATVPGVIFADVVDALAVLSLDTRSDDESAARTWQDVRESLGDPYSVTPTRAPSRIDATTTSGREDI
jgi:predicted O-methyltransferase YrrM